MQTTSLVTGKTYNTEEVRYIPNMLQNYKYLNSNRAHDDLVDIIAGGNNKIVFVWKKSEVMDELYDLWCNKQLG